MYLHARGDDHSASPAVSLSLLVLLLPAPVRSHRPSLFLPPPSALTARLCFCRPRPLSAPVSVSAAPRPFSPPVSVSAAPVRSQRPSLFLPPALLSSRLPPPPARPSLQPAPSEQCATELRSADAPRSRPSRLVLGSENRLRVAQKALTAATRTGAAGQTWATRRPSNFHKTARLVRTKDSRGSLIKHDKERDKTAQVVQQPALDRILLLIN